MKEYPSYTWLNSKESEPLHGSAANQGPAPQLTELVSSDAGEDKPLGSLSVTFTVSFTV